MLLANIENMATASHDRRVPRQLVEQIEPSLTDLFRRCVELVLQLIGQGITLTHGCHPEAALAHQRFDLLRVGKPGIGKARPARRSAVDAFPQYLVESVTFFGNIFDVVRQPVLDHGVRRHKGREDAPSNPKNAPCLKHCPHPLCMFQEMIQWPHQEHGIKRVVIEGVETPGIGVDHSGKLNAFVLSLLLCERKGLGCDVNQRHLIALTSKGYGVSTDASTDISHSRRRRWKMFPERAHRKPVFNLVPQEPVPLVFGVLVVVASDLRYVVGKHGEIIDGW